MSVLPIAAGLLIVAAPIVVAQEAPMPAERTTQAGVYTPDQATRGRNLFLGSCKSCHAPESQTGANFARLWGGKELLILYKYISEKMPDNDPGSLAPETSADIIAYLLQLNEMPAGGAELVADSTALRGIKVEIKEPKEPASKPITLSPRR